MDVRKRSIRVSRFRLAYDNRDRTAPTDDKVRFAVQSMMLKERLK